MKVLNLVKLLPFRPSLHFHCLLNNFTKVKTFMLQHVKRTIDAFSDCFAFVFHTGNTLVPFKPLPNSPVAKTSRANDDLF